MYSCSFEATKSWPVPVEQESGIGFAEPVPAREMAADEASPEVVAVGVVVSRPESELWA